MKKPIVITILVVVLLVLGFFAFNSYIYHKEQGDYAPDKTNPNMNNTDTSDSSIPNGKYCFSYSKKATELEPYQVEEHVVLNVKDGSVTGTKEGTQNGPDMTNGYQGTLNGTANKNIIEAVYSYTIEGSQNKELETYEKSNDLLIKMRWPLTQGSGMLVPDKTVDPKIISYTAETCAQ